MAYTELNRLNWVVDKVKNVSDIFDANVISQLEPLLNTKLQKPQFIVFSEPSEVVEAYLGCEYRSVLYHIVWITEKPADINEKISKFNEYFPQVFFDNMSDSENPFILIGEFTTGIENEDGSILGDYPVIEEIKYKNK